MAIRPMLKRLLFFLLSLFCVDMAFTRPIDMPDPIWCLSDAQTIELAEKYKLLMKDGGDAVFSLLVLRKVGYLTDERRLYTEKRWFAACQNRTQKDANAKPCSDTGVQRLEAILTETEELESRPLTEPNRTKMQFVSEKQKAIRAEYPSCQ
jgi:hypothetical protein